MFTSDQLRDHIRLASVPGIGPRFRKLLLERFGSPAGIFAASPAELQSVARLGKKLVEAISAAATSPAADEVIRLCQKQAVDIVLEGSEGYPPLLSRIDDPPGLLFVRGAFLPCDALAVAVVGSRHATPYGIKVAEQLGGSLARAGYTVVSGLARGIDAAAHRGAIAAGGRTIAVLGSGVLNVYPPEHEDLAAEVAKHGALVSEVPPLNEPFSGAFPQRNRIVSGMSLGTVVVQAAERSGALITSRLAAEQGREVFAVPGPIDCRLSGGCHALIRDGAKLVHRVDDIIEEFGPLFETATTPEGTTVASAAELQLGNVERSVLDCVGSGSVTVDEIVETSDLAASQVLSTLSVLEMRRLVRRIPGNRIERM
jgi:DNA processing protein